ncbi:MAG TPA: hypothetical protein VMF57_03750 [Solirubrobacteraceae bacterium]|nr:hypothetical protein [Solirubrobacteraceae bacterium]
MKLRRLTRAGRRRADVDEAVAAYSAWRRECAAVRAAYGKWARAAKSEACSAFVAYRVALDREEQAAVIYARLLPRARRRPELDVARQLAQIAAPFGAM